MDNSVTIDREVAESRQLGTSSSPLQSSASGRTSSGTYLRIPPSRPPTKTTLDLDAYLAWVAGHPISLRPMEQRLLVLLSNSPNRVVAAEDLVVALYGSIDRDAGRVRLRRLVTDIRKRLGEEFAQRLRTVHKIGLVLVTAGDTQEER